MIIKNFNAYFFFVLLIGISILGFMLIKPFLSAIFIAALFAVIFAHPYDFLLKKIHSASITSAIMLIVVMITIIMPFVFVGGLVFNEVSNVVSESTKEESTVQIFAQNVVNTLVHAPVFNSVLDKAEIYISSPEFENTIKNVANNSILFIKAAYRSVISSTISIFVMFFALFYFFIDGKKFMKKIMNLSPMKNSHEQMLIDEFISMTRATLKGTIVIGTIQGIIGGVALAIAGVTSPVLWTVIMIVLSIIPAIGAGLVIFPASIIMFILGNVWQGVFLFGTGIFVSTIDNMLRPRLVGKDVQMHSLAVFFATIGGLKLFGIMGFIIGPIIIALMLAMYKIYELEFRSQLKEFNT